jgi:predicted DNA-binding protein (UPF0251 family)
MQATRGPRNYRIVRTPEGAMTLSEAAQRYGISRRALDYRIKRGWSVEACVSAAKKPDPHRRLLVDTPDGPMTRAEAASFYGVNRRTLTRRLWEGKPVRRALTPALEKRRRIWDTPYGRMSLYRLQNIIQIDIGMLLSRVYRLRWTEEDAFNTPPFGKRGRHFILPPDEYRRRLVRVKGGKCDA